MHHLPVQKYVMQSRIVSMNNRQVFLELHFSTIISDISLIAENLRNYHTSSIGGTTFMISLSHVMKNNISNRHSCISNW